MQCLNHAQGLIATSTTSHSQTRPVFKNWVGSTELVCRARNFSRIPCLASETDGETEAWILQAGSGMRAGGCTESLFHLPNSSHSGWWIQLYPYLSDMSHQEFCRQCSINSEPHTPPLSPLATPGPHKYSSRQ